MTNTNARPARCRDCGSTDVEWRQNKAGKWYLADLRHGIRGSVYSDGPHYGSCSVKGPRAERLRAIEEHNARVEAERAAEAKKSAEINARMLEMIKSGMSSDEIVAAIYNEEGDSK
jgi:hypothetical protein